jgi:hypothetical protein
MQRRICLAGVAQLLGRGTRAPGRECRQGGRIGFAVRQGLQHAAGTDAEQIRHEAGHLDVRFLSSALSRFCSCTRLRVTWYLRRITVR